MPNLLNSTSTTERPNGRSHSAASDVPYSVPTSEQTDARINEETEASGVSLQSIPAFLMIIVAVVPFWLMPAAHVASNPETATGFFHEELPYYMANGRAAFDRGNGIFYPNPYDPDPAAPVIYAHWLLWVFGTLPAILQTDPGHLTLAATFFASLIFSTATWLLVRERVINPDQPHIAFLAAMWGGGLLVVAGFTAGYFGYTNPDSTLLQFDPGRGLWFLNWGRNASFATEAIYHSLVAACWLSEMKQRRIAGSVFCFLLATTHPWSGLELLLTLNLWRGLQWLRNRKQPETAHLAVTATMLVVFLGYYQVWLPRFAQHAQLQNVWELDWNLSATSAMLAYAVVFIFACRQLSSALLFGQPAGTALQHFGKSPKPAALQTDVPQMVARSLTTAEQFLCCALLVAVGLAFHDRLIKPVQPLHFTRGYVWMPLFLLGLPSIQLAWKKAAQHGLAGRTLISICALLFVTDNFAFALIQANWQTSQHRGYHLHSNDRALINDLHQRSPRAVVLTESEALNYLLPAYANIRPWLGHPYNTPDYQARLAKMKSSLPGDAVHPEHLAPDIDVLVISRQTDTTALQNSGRWVPLECRNAGWQLWGQISPDPAPTP